MNTDDLIRIKIAEAARKIAAARAQREKRQAARTRGLALRHAAKLRSLAAGPAVQDDDDQPLHAAPSRTPRAQNEQTDPATYDHRPGGDAA